MGKIYARLIYKTWHGETTKYQYLSDVPSKYQDATRSAYWTLFGENVPEKPINEVSA